MGKRLRRLNYKPYQTARHSMPVVDGLSGQERTTRLSGIRRVIMTTERTRIEKAPTNPHVQ